MSTTKVPEPLTLTGMTKRAQAHQTIEIPGASHVLPVSHPNATAHLILEAAAICAAA
jgi:hypothetical protein